MLSLSEVQELVFALPAEARAKLVEAILLSLESEHAPSVSEAWQREAADRLAAHQRGNVAAIPADEVFDEAHRLVG